MLEVDFQAYIHFTKVRRFMVNFEVILLKLIYSLFLSQKGISRHHYTLAGRDWKMRIRGFEFVLLGSERLHQRLDELAPTEDDGYHDFVQNATVRHSYVIFRSRALRYL